MQEAELAQMYERYGYLVRRRCLSIVGNQPDADDALQEVFLRVHRHHGGHAGGSLLGWLYAIAANCCYDLLRKNRRADPTEHQRLAQLDRRTQGEPGENDRRVLLGTVLRRLDRKCCEIGVLHHLDGYTQEEVAALTGYSRRTVGKKLTLFEAEFRQAWREGGGE